eukprot:550004-Rhodomonas_salina.1
MLVGPGGVLSCRTPTTYLCMLIHSLLAAEGVSGPLQHFSMMSPQLNSWDCAFHALLFLDTDCSPGMMKLLVPFNVSDTAKLRQWLPQEILRHAEELLGL